MYFLVLFMGLAILFQLTYKSFQFHQDKQNLNRLETQVKLGLNSLNPPDGVSEVPPFPI